MGQETVVRRIKNLPADTPPGIRLADLLCWNEINAIPPPFRNDDGSVCRSPRPQGPDSQGGCTPVAGAKSMRKRSADESFSDWSPSPNTLARERFCFVSVSVRRWASTSPFPRRPPKESGLSFPIARKPPQLFRLESLEELAPGTMGILEPKADLCQGPTERCCRKNSI